MSPEERERLIGMISNPPHGSKLAEAKEYGIDLTLLVRRLELSPTERLEELESVQHFIEQLRAASRER
jgi:hypothetical protein